MYWPLQENFLDTKTVNDLCYFIKSNNRLTQFTKVRNFEKNFSKWNGSKFSIFVNSGSSANLIMVQSCKEIYKWKNNDEIIVPSVTWPTTVTPVSQSGLKPIFVDVNLKDFSFDYDDLKKKITNKTKAIFVAHLIGFPANIKKIKRIIGKKKIVLLEDCCESQGAKINQKKVGNFGIAGSFSFYWGHHMSTIEGGMICTNDEKFYNLCLLKRSHGLARELPLKKQNFYKRKYSKNNFKFLFLTDGFNLRSTEINAFLGLKMLKKINSWIKIRNNNYENFINIIKKYKNKFKLLKNQKDISSFVLPFLMVNKIDKIKLENLLNTHGIETRPFIAGNLLRQPFLSRYSNKNFLNADIIEHNAFYIGNNQFVNKKRINKLEIILDNFFKIKKK
ncbi:DegT/DnrJ/EryC1/StrS aminotransferase family protein [Candidatus Pelagibacter sp.]|nr:DegT/DnrJ/EryC1/StrS aminotransferase family protein [Candidatus Pelagibacter sp.]